MARPFHKMHGLGNDFVIFDGREEPLAMTEPLARAVADRRTGIGCDQLIVLEPSSRANVRMRIYNHDGGEVQSCGNASRCVVALTGARTIETGGGVIAGSEDGGRIEVSLIEPRFAWDQVPITYPMDTDAVPMGWGPLEKPMAVNVGNPHLVFFVDDVDAIDLVRLGPSIEHDPAFPERINVNVAQVKDGAIRLRTWERGAGLTLACGTGACATAVAAIKSKRVTSPVKVTMQGGSLEIAWVPGEPVRMIGSATYVFRGEIELERLGA
ncbi:diaminopimelate epimerase [Sphingomonas sp. BN140010]|uniref:Diaminopimelate epimerase n=1 Tax=Sphingomonas arvum TaxID=2992113 RepID=A0ABT3JDP3_9SPHN|nr:diaminopimelate epimerase [Sphingomonas sp. BN140010]MCW3797029.1 diaminopimelate epimerase [Sphingomonas sp. BN140010]